MDKVPEPVGAGDFVIGPGDSMVSIAAATGHLPDTIWNDAANSALKDARKDGELLLPGDKITVAAIAPKLEPRATGKRHVFQRKGLTVKLTLYVQDDEGAAFASKKYELAIDGHPIEGTTDDKGKIEQTIAARSREGTLKVWLDEPGLPNPWVRELRLATLYPIAHPQGIEQRLANLGYTGDAAVAAFQKAQGLEASGTIDDALRTKLVEVHKS
jgi:hypothetical protein